MKYLEIKYMNIYQIKKGTLEIMDSWEMEWSKRFKLLNLPTSDTKPQFIKDFMKE